MTRLALASSLLFLASCDLEPPPSAPEEPAPEREICNCPDDGIACTSELCDDAGECVHRADDRFCSAAGSCLVGMCDPNQGGCVTESRPTGTPCVEGEAPPPGSPGRGCIEGECLPGHVIGLERVRVLRITGTPPSSDDGFLMDLARVDDRNGDGVDDIALTSIRLVGFVPDPLPGRVLLVDPVTGIVLWESLGTPENEVFGYRLMSTGDFNGDGLSDLVTTERVGGVPAVVGLDGSTGAIAWRFEEPNAMYTRLADAGDQNGDGIDDVYVAIGLGLARVSGADGSIIDATAGAYGPDIASVSDVDGDGLRDVLVDSEPAVYRFVRLVSSMGLEDIKTFELPEAHVWVSGSSDVNGDGVDEGLLTHTDGSLREREAYDLVTDQSYWVQRYPRSAPVAIYDVDGDGIDDMLTDGSHLGSGWRTIIAQSGADGTVAFEFIPVDDHGAVAPIDTNFVQIGDVNGDGVDDFAVGDLLTGSRVWLYASVVRWF